jgi:hypothetical protein
MVVPVWMIEVVSIFNLPYLGSHSECRLQVINNSTIGYPNSGWIAIGITDNFANQHNVICRLMFLVNQDIPNTTMLGYN